MSLVETRESLHALAEHVLAPARYAVTGRIGLRAMAGGFGTPPFPGPDGRDRQVFERDAAIHVRDGDDVVASSPITTLRAAANFVGVVPGAPAEVYTPATPLDLDRTLAIDRGADQAIADWFALANEALHQLVSLASDAPPSEIQLWPEHFDLATTIDKVNYGASPGDTDHPEPYLYVGPFDPREGPFWNEPFGASLGRDRVNDVAAALGFWLEGRDLTQ
jgi:hypothetical protein